MITYRQATLDDAVSLSKRLRREDAIEVSLTTGDAPEATLKASVGSPAAEESWAAVGTDGKVIALWGVHRYQLVAGIPWMLASPEVTRYSKRLVKDGRQWVNRINLSFPILTNMVHADNTSAINWLKSLGFTIGALYPEFGVGKAPFYQFHKYSPFYHHV